jgi:hypothetical protein
MIETQNINEIEFDKLKSDVLGIISKIENSLRNKKKLIIMYKLIKRLYNNE